MNKYLSLIYTLVLAILTGCTSTQTFHTIARAGDTVALPIGLKTDVLRSNLTVTITPNGGIPVVYAPGQPSGTPVVRAVVYLNADPLSRMTIGRETNQSMGVNANFWAPILEAGIASGNKEWWNTVVFLDLPNTLTPGTATIDLDNGTSTVFQSATVDIVDYGVPGGPNLFDTVEGGPLSNEQVQTMERADYYSVNFSGSTVPHAVQVDLSRTPGVGVPWIVNPRGDIKSVSWTDDGTNMRVILIPANNALVSNQHFRFFVAGDITGLSHVFTQAFDINGSPISPPLTTSILFNN